MVETAHTILFVKGVEHGIELGDLRIVGCSIVHIDGKNLVDARSQ